ncbi:unnamed protein product, partial [Amoebophrya sp. A120]|eukprot:GSA120T00019668001.1
MYSSCACLCFYAYSLKISSTLISWPTKRLFCIFFALNSNKTLSPSIRSTRKRCSAAARFVVYLAATCFFVVCALHLLLHVNVNLVKGSSSAAEDVVVDKNVSPGRGRGNLQIIANYFRNPDLFRSTDANVHDEVLTALSGEILFASTRFSSVKTGATNSTSTDLHHLLLLAARLAGDSTSKNPKYYRELDRRFRQWRQNEFATFGKYWTCGPLNVRRSDEFFASAIISDAKTRSRNGDEVKAAGSAGARSNKNDSPRIFPASNLINPLPVVWSEADLIPFPFLEQFLELKETQKRFKRDIADGGEKLEELFAAVLGREAQHAQDLGIAQLDEELLATSSLESESESSSLNNAGRLFQKLLESVVTEGNAISSVTLLRHDKDAAQLLNKQNPQDHRVNQAACQVVPRICTELLDRPEIKRCDEASASLLRFSSSGEDDEHLQAQTQIKIFDADRNGLQQQSEADSTTEAVTSTASTRPLLLSRPVLTVVVLLHAKNLIANNATLSLTVGDGTTHQEAGQAVSPPKNSLPLKLGKP